MVFNGNRSTVGCDGVHLSMRCVLESAPHLPRPFRRCQWGTSTEPTSRPGGECHFRYTNHNNCADSKCLLGCMYIIYIRVYVLCFCPFHVLPSPFFALSLFYSNSGQWSLGRFFSAVPTAVHALYLHTWFKFTT